VTRDAERRLRLAEQRAAVLPRAIPPAVAAWLRSLSDSELEAVERAVHLMIYGHLSRP
jgi:hypothetical protein